MITLTASGSSVIFTFDGNSTYLNDGTIEVPKNSLALIIDESDMATFRKAASNDIFVSANISEFGMTKAELESWYKANMVSSGGGGGGVTPEEVEEMIDEAVSGKADSSAVYLKSETSGATEISTALAQKLGISDFNTYSGAVDTLINSKASQNAVDTLSGVVTSHTSDNTIHLTSGDVQTQIDNSISGKANSSDVYLKSETSGATEIANALAQKQNQLVAGDNITISGNVISAQGGGCEVEETVIYDRLKQSYYDYSGDKGKQTYTIIDYLGDKTTSTSIQISFEIGNTSDSYYGWIYFDYVNHSANTDSSISDYVTTEYINDIQDFKVSVASAYQSTYWFRGIQSLDELKNALIPFYTINSGSPCTVISTDVAGVVEKVKDKAYQAISECVLQSSSDEMYLNTYRIDGGYTKTVVKLEELDGSSSKLKPNIQIGLGVSGWTEMTFNGSCNTNGNPKSPIIRMSGVTNSLDAFNTQWEVLLDHYGNAYDGVIWNGSEFVLNSNWFGENGEFGTATVTYDNVNNTLTIAYPLTAQVGGYTDNVGLKNIYNNNCQFGTAITKFEYYGELTQPLKPYVQETKAALGGISLVKLTESEYAALVDKDPNVLYVVIPDPTNP